MFSIYLVIWRGYFSWVFLFNPDKTSPCLSYDLRVNGNSKYRPRRRRPHTPRGVSLKAYVVFPQRFCTIPFLRHVSHTGDLTDLTVTHPHLIPTRSLLRSHYELHWTNLFRGLRSPISTSPPSLPQFFQFPSQTEGLDLLLIVSGTKEEPGVLPLSPSTHPSSVKHSNVDTK